MTINRAKRSKVTLPSWAYIHKLQPKTKVLGRLLVFLTPSPLIPPLPKLLLTQLLNLHCILYGRLQHWIWGRGGLKKALHAP